MNVKKTAARDAQRWAAAEMFYGEGAGTRRKLLQAELLEKYNLPGYYDSFMDAYNRLDMNKFAKDAIKERRRIDRSKSISRNVRGLITGNKRSLTNTVAVGVTVWFIAKETGLDEPIKREVKVRYRQTKTWVESQKAKRKLKINPDGTYRFKG